MAVEIAGSGEARRRPREERAGDPASERILTAALEAFSQNGFDGARTRDIAARADVTLGLLQYYYGGKRQLWEAAVDLAFEELEEGIGDLFSADGPSSPRERFRAGLRAHVRFVARKPAFARLMHDEGKRDSERMRWLVERHVRPLFTRFSPLIADAQREGLLASDVDPLHYVYILIGAVSLIFHQAEECKVVTGVDPTSEAAVEAHIRAVEALFVGPPAEESHP